MALVKIKFKNGTIKEVAEHLATNSALQKAQGFVVLGENGEEITTPEPKQEKKNQDVTKVAEVEIVPPVQSVVEIVSPLDETSKENTTEENQPKKRGRKPKQ